MTVYKTVTEVKKDITEIINRLIHSPSLTENGEDKGYTESQEVILKTAEIERMTAASEVDITAVQKLIFECAEEKYREKTYNRENESGAYKHGSAFGIFRGNIQQNCKGDGYGKGRNGKTYFKKRNCFRKGGLVI